MKETGKGEKIYKRYIRNSLSRLTECNLTSSTGRRVDTSRRAIGDKVTTVLVRTCCKSIRGNMSCSLDRRCRLHDSRSRNVVFLGLHERSLGNDGNSFLGLLSISTKDRDRGSSSRRSMNSRRRTIRNEVSTVLVRSGGESVRARSFLHDRSGSGGCSSLRLLYTLLLRVSSKNRDLSSSSGGCVDSCLYLFICVLR